MLSNATRLPFGPVFKLTHGGENLALTADPTPTPGALPSLLSSPRHGHSGHDARYSGFIQHGWLEDPRTEWRFLARKIVYEWI